MYNSRVVKTITKTGIIRNVEIVTNAVQRDIGLKSVRVVAVVGINPITRTNNKLLHHFRLYPLHKLLRHFLLFQPHPHKLLTRQHITIKHREAMEGWDQNNHFIFKLQLFNFLVIPLKTR